MPLTSKQKELINDFKSIVSATNDTAEIEELIRQSKQSVEQERRQNVTQHYEALQRLSADIESLIEKFYEDQVNTKNGRSVAVHLKPSTIALLPKAPSSTGTTEERTKKQEDFEKKFVNFWNKNVLGRRTRKTYTITAERISEKAQLDQEFRNKRDSHQTLEAATRKVDGTENQASKASKQKNTQPNIHTANKAALKD